MVFISITDVKLSCSGLEQHDLEFIGHKLADFRAIRIAQDGVVERSLRFHVYAPADVAPLVTAYVSAIGEGRGKLTVAFTRQARLDEQGDGSEVEQLTLPAPEEPEKPRSRKKQAEKQD